MRRGGELPWQVHERKSSTEDAWKHTTTFTFWDESPAASLSKKKTESGRSVTRDELTCVEEGGDGHAADQVLQQQALSGDQDGHKGRQRVVEGQVAHLKKGARR